MSEVIESEKIADSAFKKYIPILTSICGLLCIVLFVGVNLEDNRENWETYKKWGAPLSIDIFDGSYWGLITSNFLHIEIWHIGFNLYWLWILGKKIEFETSKIFYAIFIVSSAVVSSTVQLAFSSSTGIGISGVVYAFFGFIVVMSRITDKYKNYLEKKIVYQFAIWLVVCIILTQTGALAVANAAHISGLLWGMTIAYTSKFAYRIQWVVGVASLLFIGSSIFWSPFSTGYLSHKAYHLHNDKKLEEASEIYKEILHREPDNGFAQENLKVIEVSKMEENAYEFHSKGKYDEAREIYNQILNLDNDNEWARKNLEMIIESDSI